MTSDTPGQPEEIASPDRRGGVTARAVLVAFALLIVIALVNFYVEISWGTGWESWMLSCGAPTVVPVSLLFLLTALAAIPTLRRWALSRRELLVIYSVVLVGAPVLTERILAWMLVKVVKYYYGAGAQPIWETTFLQHVPTWFGPSDPVAVEGFFEGQAAVPWSLWWAPLAAWSAFMVALFISTLCLMVLIQRQWITNERLTFPIAQIPLQMVRRPEAAQHRSAGRLPLARAFWIGLVISFSLNFISALSARVPALPSIPLGPMEIIPWQKVGPLAGVGGVWMLLWPWMIAIAYLVPKELSFSVWFFWLIRIALTVAAIAAGATAQRPEDWWSASFPAPYYQASGAVLALTVWTLWVARRHLNRAIRIAFSGRSGREDAQEPLSYRWALIGFVLSSAFMVYFCWLAGCRIVFGIALLGLILAYLVTWSRLRAETGLGFLAFPMDIQDVLRVPFGTGVFRATEIVTLISLRWTSTPGFSTSFEVFPGSVLESFKIADAAQINSRRLTAAMIAGFLLSLVVSIFVLLSGLYHYGWYGLWIGQHWAESQSTADGNRIVEFLINPAYGEADLNGVLALLAGAAGVVILGMMRLRFWWWPFHPVGYIAANTWGMHWWYMPFFVGWLCKTLVIRYGGLKLYRRTVPLAIGLIVGDLLDGAVWAAVKVMTLGRS